MPTATPTPSATPVPTLAPLGPDGELLVAFVRGESKATVDEDFHGENLWDDTLPEMEPFTAQELFQQLGELEYYTEEDRPQGTMFYAVLKTQGGREMLVLYHGSGAAMGPFTYLVFGAFDGQVRMTFAITFGYRFIVDLQQNLVFFTQGSMGAGAGHDGAGYIDDTGHYRELYYRETLFDLWVSAYTDIDMDDSETLGVMCTLLFLDGKEYYELEPYTEGGTTPADLAVLDKVREQLNSQGREETDSVEDLISDAYTAHGLEDAALFEDWLPWPPEG